MVEHFITMYNRETGEEINYKNVIGFELLENGYYLQLKFTDGTTSTFTNIEWIMYDFTPQRGWNYDATLF